MKARLFSLTLSLVYAKDEIMVLCVQSTVAIFLAALIWT